MSQFNDLTRRAALAGVAALAPAALHAAPRKVVTLLGDSLTSGYGLSAKVALPAIRADGWCARRCSPTCATT